MAELPVQGRADVTALLVKANGGDKVAAGELYLLVRDYLARVTRRRRVGRRGEVLGQSTMGVVDEAFVEVVCGGRKNWQPGERGRFFRFAARAIDDLLIEAYRKHDAAKRNNGRVTAEIDPGLDPDADAPTEVDIDRAIDVHDGLTALDQFNPVWAAVVRSRDVLGFTAAETADALELTDYQADKAYARGKAWLAPRLAAYAPPPGSKGGRP